MKNYRKTKLYKMQGTTIDEAGLTWYGGRDTTLTMKDVLYSDYIEMCSSAGD